MSSNNPSLRSPRPDYHNSYGQTQDGSPSSYRLIHFEENTGNTMSSNNTSLRSPHPGYHYGSGQTWNGSPSSSYHQPHPNAHYKPKKRSHKENVALIESATLEDYESEMEREGALSGWISVEEHAAIIRLNRAKNQSRKDNQKKTARYCESQRMQMQMKALQLQKEKAENSEKLLNERYANSTSILAGEFAKRDAAMAKAAKANNSALNKVVLKVVKGPGVPEEISEESISEESVSEESFFSSEEPASGEFFSEESISEEPVAKRTVFKPVVQPKPPIQEVVLGQPVPSTSGGSGLLKRFLLSLLSALGTVAWKGLTFLFNRLRSSLLSALGKVAWKGLLFLLSMPSFLLGLLLALGAALLRHLMKSWRWARTKTKRN